MSTIAETAVDADPSPQRIDGWRWAGRIFLCSCCSTPPCR